MSIMRMRKRDETRLTGVGDVRIMQQSFETPAPTGSRIAGT